MIDPAIVLLAHGSPDPEWVRPVAATESALRALLPEHAVRSATLGDDSLPLVCRGLATAGHAHVVVMSLFLSAGGRHVKHDIPARVAEVRASFSNLTITLIDGALGEDPLVAAALAQAAANALARHQ